ncbi:MAG: 1,4-dihydroxy-2-naphthoate octaprenyltransferase [Chlamydiales bacterium]|nr:1,4-dihydroxy-2-naphthoate octaprenyltransferase [Chlamydiales bacterium]
MIWFEALRPKTLIISIAPVAIGTVLAPSVNVWIFLLTLLCALSIQVGTNFANDYYDFKSGSDTHERKGPRRLLTTGHIQPGQMKLAMIFSFALAGIGALWLIAIGGVIIFVLLVLAILSGIFYTAGKYSLKRTGLADFFVFIFFGPIATMATYYLQTGAVHANVFWASLAPGLIPVAVLTANNVRDRLEDKKCGKKTLTVRFGRRFGQIQYTLCLICGVVSCVLLGLYLPLIAMLACIPLIKTMWTYRSSKKLIKVLAGTGMVLMLYTGLFCIGAAL